MSLDELEKLNLAIRMAGFRWRRANILYHKVSMYMYDCLPPALYQGLTTSRPTL